MAGDGYYSQVSLLLPMSGGNNTTSFLDLSSTPKTVTAFGDAKVVTSQTDPFGGSGGVGFFDGFGDYLNVTDAGDLNFGSADFTIECFVRLAAHSQQDATGNAYWGSGLICKDNVNYGRCFNLMVDGYSAGGNEWSAVSAVF